MGGKMKEYWIHGKIFIVYLRFYFKKSLKFKITIEIWNIGCYCIGLV